MKGDNKEITTYTQPINTVTEKVINDFLFTDRSNMSEAEKMLFLNMAKEFNLNPFKREIYPIKFSTYDKKTGKTTPNFQIVTGYQVYISRADQTGKLNGWWVEFSNDGETATLVVNRKDWNHQFRWDVYKSEVSKNNKIWRAMPKFMLKKVAIAQGFRMCFPNEFSGLPYTNDELTSEDDIKEAKKYNEKKPEIDRYLYCKDLIEKTGATTGEVAQYYNIETLDELDKEDIEKLIVKFENSVKNKSLPR